MGFLPVHAAPPTRTQPRSCSRTVARSVALLRGRRGVGPARPRCRGVWRGDSPPSNFGKLAAACLARVQAATRRPAQAGSRRAVAERASGAREEERVPILTLRSCASPQESTPSKRRRVSSPRTRGIWFGGVAPWAGWTCTARRTCSRTPRGRERRPSSGICCGKASGSRALHSDSAESLLLKSFAAPASPGSRV